MVNAAITTITTDEAGHVTTASTTEGGPIKAGATKSLARFNTSPRNCATVHREIKLVSTPVRTRGDIVRSSMTMDVNCADGTLTVAGTTALS
jgi:hypothetical protein